MSEVNNRPGLLGKLKKLQDVMGSIQWEKDGINRHQSYKYITERQYKEGFRDALREAGLLWQMETLEYEIVPQITDKMHMIVCKFLGRITDPETGEFQEYRFFGTGADTGDKALYKAVTGGHKFFLASNFNVAEGNDPESDESENLPKKGQPLTKEERKEKVIALTDGNTAASAMQVDALKKSLKMLREADPSQEGFILDIATKTKGFQNISRSECEALIIKVNELLAAIKKK